MNIRLGLRFCTRMLVCGLALGALLPVLVQAQTLSSRRQLGTSEFELSSGVATDSKGNFYITGSTNGSLAGANQGGNDAWVAKYNSTGALVWKKQLGTSVSDDSNGVATDSKGNVYISGATEGSLEGDNQGGIDAWVAKYNSAGALVWKKQLGTSSYDSSFGIATDSNSNVYISGATESSLGGDNQGLNDAWVAKYSSAGALVWKKQLGTSSNDYSSGVATDSIGNVYISGPTSGSLAGDNQGPDDAWVAKYNTSGKLLWQRQLGTSVSDRSSSVATDSKGNVYISGSTNGSLAGANQGGDDPWVAKYNSSGKLVWQRQLGTFSYESSEGVATDSNSNVYISGNTDGSLAGANQGGFDAWVAKYSQL